MAYQYPLNGGRINASVGGNSTSAGAGYQLVSTGTLLLAGGNNITLSQNGSAITISGANAPSGSINFSAGTTSGNINSVAFSNSNGVSFGLNAGTITASHNGITSQSVQTIGGYASGNTTGQSSSSTFDARSVSVSAQGGVSAGFSGGMMQISGPSVSSLSHTGAVSISRNGNTISIGAPVQTAYSFANSNGVSFGTNASTVTASVATNYAASNHSHGNPTLALTNISGTTASASNGLTLSLSAAAPGGGGGIALANSQTTYTSGTANMVVAGGAMTIASTTGQSFNFSVPATSSISATGALSISTNGATVSMGVPAQTNQTLGISATSNTFSSSNGTVDARSLYLRGVGAASVGISNGSILISAPNAAAGNVTVSAGANSAGLASLVFSNSNGVSFGLNGSTITASAPGGGGGIALANSQTTYTSGTANMVVAGGALTIASTTGQSFNFSAPAQSSLSATGALSLSTNGSTISIGAPATSSLSGAGGIGISTNGSTIIVSNAQTMNLYQNMDRGTTATLAVPFASMMLQRLNQENDLLPANITANTVLLNMTANMTATSLSSSHSVSVSVGIYSDYATALSLVNSASTSWVLGAATGNTSNYHGPRWLSFVSSQWSSAPNFVQGGEYVFGVLVRTSNYAPPLSYIGQNYMASNQRSGFIGTSFATNTTLAQGNYWNGVMNTTALPTGITSNQINRNNASAIFIPHMVLNNRYSGTF